MNTHKTTRIMAIAVFLAIVTAGAPLWAQTHTLTTADFKEVSVLDDGSGVRLVNYTGSAQNIMVPAELEGLPVKWVSFEKNTTIRSVTTADGFTGSFSFAVCSSLTSVTLPKGIKKIGWGMFYGCTSLTSVTIPAGVTEIGEAAFRDCTSLASLTIPAGVTTIGVAAFQGCASLASLTIPASVTTIGVAAFQDCTSLTSLTIPAGVKHIASSTFSNCTKLTDVTLPKGLTRLDDQGYGQYLTYQWYKEDLVYRDHFDVYPGAFNGCSSLKRITIPAGVRNIGRGVFAGCAALEEITFEGNVEIDNSFENCKNIKRLNAGPGVTKITGLRTIPLTDVSGLPLKEQAEIKAYRSAFARKYGN